MLVESQGRQKFFMGFGKVLKDAFWIAAICTAFAILVNFVHPNQIPFIAKEEYQILVPCPEPGGAVTPLEAGDPKLRAKETFLVDARSSEQHKRWKFGQAMNVPFDYLDPVPQDTLIELAEKITQSRAQRVVVYGDGNDPDTGEQLGKEISGRGIKNVFFIKGGAPALKKAKSREDPDG